MARRGTQLSRRRQRRSSTFSSRRFDRPIQRQLVNRNRLFVRAEQRERRLIAIEEEKVNSLIKDINAGRVSNINQIPEKYRAMIGVTQSDLNKIVNYYRAKKQADLWESAFRLADKVITSSNPSAIFAIAFSDNPYAKEAYQIRNSQYKAYQERRKVIQDIRTGKVTDVAIVGNRIVNTKTNTPITPTQISKKQYADLINKELPGGDKLILDKQYNIKGINSKILGRSIPYNPRGVEFYAREVSKIPRSSINNFFPTKESKRNVFEKIKLAGKNALKSPTGKNLVSESVYRQISLNALLGNKVAEKALDKIDGYIPEEEIRAKKISFAKSQTIVGKLKTIPIKGDKLYGSSIKFVKEWNDKKIKALSRKTGIPIKRIERDMKSYLNDAKKLAIKRYGLNKLSFKKWDAWIDKEKKKLSREIDRQEKYLKKNSPFKVRYGAGLVTLIPNVKTIKKADLIRYNNNVRKYIGLHVAKTIVGMGIGIPALITALKTKPLQTITSLPPAIVEGVKQDFSKLVSGDGRNMAEVVIEYYLYSKAFKLAGKGLGKVRTGALKLSPNKAKVVGNKIVVKKAGVTLKKQTVSSGAKSLKQQAKLAGKSVTAVTAQANKFTKWWRRTARIRKPLLAKEKGATYLDDYAKILAKDPKNGRRIVRILKKFDAKKRVTNKEFADINAWLRKNVADNITLLERSLYLDPASGLRISRLQITTPRDATLKDILKGNFKLWAKADNPRILVFLNAKVAKFPKKLSDVARKLRAGKKLTTSETNRLIRWQVETGKGKFKPIGSTLYQGGRELEITLSPGNWIKEIKTIGFYLHQGKKVPIVLAEVYKPSKSILAKIKLAHAGKLAKKELKQLEKFLSKQLKRRVQLETPKNILKSARALAREARRYDPRIPVVRLRGKGLVIVSRAKRKAKKTTIKRRKVTRTKKPTRKTTRRTTRRTTTRKRVTRKAVKRSSKRTTRKRTQRTPRSSTRKPKRRPVRRTPTKKTTRRTQRRPTKTPKKTTKKKKVTPRTRTKGFGKRKLRKAVQGYYIVIKIKGKKKRLNPRPLTLQDAKDFLAHKVDNGLSRTAWFEPIGKTKEVVKLPKYIQGYFLKNKKKFRPFRIRRGKKKQLIKGYIEKRKYISDTSGEKRALKKSKRRRKKRKTTIKRRKVTRKPVRRVRRKRRLTPAQKRILIKRLQKARRVRSRKLNSRRRKR